MPTQQHLLGERRDVYPVLGQHITGHQATRSRQSVRSGVEPMPLGGLAAEVEPDRMVEAGALETRHGPDASGQVASLPAIYISTSPPSSTSPVG